MTYTIYSFLIAYFLTNLLEFFPLHFMIKKPLRRKLAVLVLLNSITMPFVWLILPFFYSNYLMAFIIAELLVVVAEAAIIRRFLGQLPVTSLKVSALMNLLSAAVGFVFF